MAKFPLSCKDKTTQKMIMGFSEVEIDVAWQLVQMSSRDNKRKLKVIKNKKNDEAERSSCQSDASNEHAGYTFFEEEEEDNIFGEKDDDGYPKRRNKRFRKITACSSSSMRGRLGEDVRCTVKEICLQELPATRRRPFERAT
ncbi:unnamed protein product [Dovyalis caffra]|uniref:Uncharacterized protein n=1 Tax=Dovyalis caffra TaxID=77055 RepID=A0AAV1REH9_9ROSI|nr:unnamed protein product [Dovyalis caffra]